MPGIIFNPFRKKDLEEPSLSMLNEFWRKLAEQINELWGLTGPVLLHDDLDLQGHSILNATLAGAAASSSSTAPSLYGPHSNRPNAAGTAEGTLYLETDRTVLYQLQLVSSVKRWVYIAGIMQGLFSGRPLASSLGPGDTGLLYHAGDNGQVYKFTYPAWSTMNLRGPLIEGTNAERLAGGRCDAKNLSVGTEFFETDTLLKYMVQTVAGVNTWIAEPAADIDVQKAGALIGTRRIVNFTEDGNVTLTMADNPGATRVDIGIAATGGTSTSTKYIPVALDAPRTSSLAGNSYWTVGALTAWDAGRWQFVKDVDGKIYGMVRVPHTVAVAPAAAIVLSIAANAVGNVTRLIVSTAEVKDLDVALNYNQAALTAEGAQDITVPATAYTRKDVTFVLTTPPTADSVLIVEIYHNGVHANDTLAVDTLLFNCYLKIDVTE